MADVASQGENALGVASRVKVILIFIIFLIQYSRAVIHLAWVCVYHRVLFYWVPERKQKMLEHMNEVTHMNESALQLSDWENTLFTWQFFLQECKSHLLDLKQQVYLHGPASNVELVTLDGKIARLLDYSKHEDHPLVVNFGSCT